MLDMLGDLAGHWKEKLALFAQARRPAGSPSCARGGEVDAAATGATSCSRRAAKSWREAPPATPIVAAGVTSASPRARAAAARRVAELPQGAVVLPDLDLSMPRRRCGTSSAQVRPTRPAVRARRGGDPPAVPPQAAAQPHGRGARRSAAVAPRGPRQGPARAQPRDLEPVPAARGEQGVGRPAAPRSAASPACG